MFKKSTKPTDIFGFEPQKKRPYGFPDPTTQAGKLIRKLYGCFGGYVILLALLHLLLWSLAPLTSGFSLTYGAVVLTIMYRNTRVLNSRIWVTIEAPWYADRCGKAGVLIGIILPLTILLLLVEGLFACSYYALYA